MASRPQQQMITTAAAHPLGTPVPAIGSPLLHRVPCAPHWYAVHVRPRHEKKVAVDLIGKGVETYVPIFTEMRKWADRRKLVEAPLFPCYLFVHIENTSKERLRVVTAGGVLGLVSARGEPVPIAGDEIEYVKSVLAQKVNVARHGGFTVGQRVRVRGGVLDGIEGTLIEVRSERRLVLSVGPIERGFSVSLDGYEVEPI
jgi:transcription antitermination factor NusG